MKFTAVSLTNPWAYLVVAGIKTLETRKGALLSGFTGPLVICRTKAPSVDYDLARFGVALPAKPYTEDDRGLAIGMVRVERTWRFHPSPLMPVLGDDLHRRACYHDIDGRYLSELTGAAWFSRPVAAKGMQTRFVVDVPDDLVPTWAYREGE
jgi:hypothetical protein